MKRMIVQTVAALLAIVTVSFLSGALAVSAQSLGQEEPDATFPSAASPIKVSVNPLKSLMFTDQAALRESGFTLESVFKQFVSQTKDRRVSPPTLWKQWWDSQRKGPGLFPRTPHCDDEGVVNGVAMVNGFPFLCPRQEGNEANVIPFSGGEPDRYHITVVVNRFDLAPSDGKNCGEYRMIFAKSFRSPGRNFIIFEGILPNPRPRSGLEGCRSVAEFWASLSRMTDAVQIAKQLHWFYFRGLRGFAPVVHIDHYGRKGGQVRTNQFIGPVWLLREFHLTERCTRHGGSIDCNLLFLPVTVTNNPFGELLNDKSKLPQAAHFRKWLVGNLPGLLPHNVNRMSVTVPNEFNAGDGHSQEAVGDYAFQFAQGAGTLEADVRRALTKLKSNLKPGHVVNRLQFGSCGGCHMQSAFSPDLGHGVSAPSSLGFVHVDEESRLSEALVKTFLPDRQKGLEAFLRRAAHPLDPVVR